MGKPKIRFRGYTEDWEQRKLDDIVEFLDTMRKPLEGAKRVSGPYPYYGASGIVDYVDGYLFDEELILLSEDGANITDRNYPVCFLASGKYWVNNHAHVLRSKQENENNFICISLERKDYTQYNTGMAMPKLNKETCRKIPVLCPTFEEQQKIGDYFRSLDNLITLHQRKCEETKKLKKYMLQKMFPRNGQKVPEIRFSGFTEDWEQRKLKTVATFSKGSGYSKGDLQEDGTPIILYGRLYTKYETIISEVDTFVSEKSGSVHSQGGEVIIPASGETAEDIARASTVENKGVLLGGDLNIVIPNEDIDSAFLALSISNGAAHRELASKAQGKSVVHIHNAEIQALNIAFPSKPEQSRISVYFSNLDHLITLHQRKCDELQNIKKYMLQNMFV